MRLVPDSSTQRLASTTAGTEAQLLPSLLVADAVRLESIDLIKNRYRFFTLRWNSTLFGELALVATWGRIGRTGQSRVLGIAGSPTLAAQLDRLLHRRIQHGYTLIPREAESGSTERLITGDERPQRK